MIGAMGHTEREDGVDGRRSVHRKEVTTRKLLEQLNEYSKVAGYKINTHKSLAFLYTNNRKSETVDYLYSWKKNLC